MALSDSVPLHLLTCSSRDALRERRAGSVSREGAFSLVDL